MQKSAAIKIADGRDAKWILFAAATAAAAWDFNDDVEDGLMYRSVHNDTYKRKEANEQLSSVLGV